jgi:hypothetical protein
MMFRLTSSFFSHINRHENGVEVVRLWSLSDARQVQKSVSFPHNMRSFFSIFGHRTFLLKVPLTFSGSHE